MKRKPLVIDKDWCIVALMFIGSWGVVIFGLVRWWNS